jgi:peroxiredoxin
MHDTDRRPSIPSLEEASGLLAPPAEWEPDVPAARARLEMRRRRRSASKWYWFSGTAAAALISGVLLVNPSTRAFAQQCWQCIVSFESFVAPAGARAISDAKSRTAAPDFVLNDSKGRPVRLSDFKGRVVLLDFWATWCYGCKTEIPWFMEFEKKYKDQGLTVIGVALDGEGWKVVRPFIEQKKMNYCVVVGNDRIAKQYSVEAMPVTLLIDRQGKIAATHVGVVNQESFETEIRTLLQK